MMVFDDFDVVFIPWLSFMFACHFSFVEESCFQNLPDILSKIVRRCYLLDKEPHEMAKNLMTQKFSNSAAVPQIADQFHNL
jgi:hypothetical protein